MKIFTAVWISGLTVALMGCASNKETVFGDDMPTMKALHEKKFGAGRVLDKSVLKQRTVNKNGDQGDNQLTGKVASQVQALSKQFPFLHNPVLVTYIYPHLTQAGTPIPGYVTVFKMYQSHPIALPGELSETPANEVAR